MTNCKLEFRPMNASRSQSADRINLVFLTEDDRQFPCVAAVAFSLQMHVDLLKKQGLVSQSHRAIGVFRGLQLVDAYESDRPIGELNLRDGDRVVVGEADNWRRDRGPSIAAYEAWMASARDAWRQCLGNRPAAVTSRF
jgi:hypothetical protein